MPTRKPGDSFDSIDVTAKRGSVLMDAAFAAFQTARNLGARSVALHFNGHVIPVAYDLHPSQSLTRYLRAYEHSLAALPQERTREATQNLVRQMEDDLPDALARGHVHTIDWILDYCDATAGSVEFSNIPYLMKTLTSAYPERTRDLFLPKNPDAEKTAQNIISVLCGYMEAGRRFPPKHILTLYDLPGEYPDIFESADNNTGKRSFSPTHP